MQNQPRLNLGAVPTIFEGCPSYLSKQLVIREEPETKKRRIETSQLDKVIKESIQTHELHVNKHKVDSLDELSKKMSLVDVPNGFCHVSNNESIIFVKISIVNNVPHYLTVVINQDLSVNAFQNNINLIKINEMAFPFSVTNVQDVSNVLRVLDEHCMHEANKAQHLISTIVKLLKDLESVSSISEKLNINFIIEQMSLIFINKHQNRYSSDFLILSSLVASISPHAYNFLRNSGVLVLPHPSTLKRLFVSYNLNPKSERDENFLFYVKQKFRLLSSEDKTVVLMMDEIHLKSFLDYKGGNVLGMSFNCTEAANSAYVFMIKSIQSSYKDVVAIMPVKTLNSDTLYSFLKDVLIGLENIGYNVICIISDNNSINRKAVSNFSTPPTVKFVYPHPCDISKKLFFMIDSVHILKCIRNNWVNQKNLNCCMFYPEFPNNNFDSTLHNSDLPLNINLKTASFQAVRKLYEYERVSLVKYAYTLTTKSLFPTNIEKQNVKLVLNVFNTNVVEALNIIGDKADILDSKCTANYIDIITKWWDVMNVKTVMKGIHKRNTYQEPMRLDDFRYTFLGQFVDWLITWGNAISDTGRLTPETHLALTLTTNAMREICQYCTEKLELKFILTGKFQTDSLEERFGKYRQLAGGQYDISVTQLYESEAKLRLQSTLPLVLKSRSLGDISISFDNIENDGKNVDDNTCFDSIAVTINQDDFKQTENIMPVIVYIAGYAVHSVLKYLNNCTECKLLLTRNDDIDILYHANDILIHHHDRGGLKYPTDDVISVVQYTYIVIVKLLSEFEEIFLTMQNQRSVAINIVKNVLLEKEKYLYFDFCKNNHSSEVTVKCILKTVINILLNNYCKKKNDTIVYASHSKAKERKLKTLMKASKNQEAMVKVAMVKPKKLKCKTASKPVKKNNENLPANCKL